MFALLGSDVSNHTIYHTVMTPSHKHVGAIVGGVIGGIAGVAILALAADTAGDHFQEINAPPPSYRED
ncbi:hypothetical protein C8Q72DRAFT_949958 [Fomitopsis betulina]|nr:hypothetical protein C8Q72DRAFT_949958 [Fomitopsis betulina]